MTEQGLRKLSQEWMKRLRLENWKVDVVMVSIEEAREATGQEVCGSTLINSDHRQAKVIIVRESDLDKSDYCRLTCLDTEVTLVHELLHVKESEQFFSKSKRNSEAFIEQVAQALVAAKRGQMSV